MRTQSLILLGASIALIGGGSPAMASGQRPGMTAGHGVTHAPRANGNWTHANRWGPRQNGRWHAGWRAPGGWNAYRRPVYGYVLPRYWVSPSYSIANYGAYGLPAPAYGYGWSRYYDDAVMTDRYGRVYDTRSDIAWDRAEGGYDDGRYGDNVRRDNGVGGAAIGAVVGGVAGNRIAGRGNRTAGTLIGAGVGAVAGMAIDKAEDAHRRPGADYDHGYRYDDDAVTGGGDSGNGYGGTQYDGRWTGTWTTQDGRQTSGTYEGRFEGDVSGAGVDYAVPPYGGGAPHWSYGPQGGEGGYVSGGYYYPAPVVTTITVEPVVTTTTTTSYVTQRVRTRRAAHRACRCK